jgi:hypothetical protein
MVYAERSAYPTSSILPESTGSRSPAASMSASYGGICLRSHISMPTPGVATSCAVRARPGLYDWRRGLSGMLTIREALSKLEEPGGKLHASSSVIRNLADWTRPPLSTFHPESSPRLLEVAHHLPSGQTAWALRGPIAERSRAETDDHWAVVARLAGACEARFASRRPWSKGPSAPNLPGCGQGTDAHAGPTVLCQLQLRAIVL